MSEGFIIAIDGPSGSGKSTVAERVAKELDAIYLDTGAIYRAVAFMLDNWGVKPESGQVLIGALKKISLSLDGSSVILNGVDVTDKIRNTKVSSLASSFSALPEVRKNLLDVQRSQAGHGILVAEGRDIGTVVFPEAEIKIFLTASPEVRAKRRWKELAEKGIRETKSAILDKMIIRDKNDSSRNIAPLKMADNALLVDTSDKTIEDVVDLILGLVRKYIMTERIYK